MNWTMAQVIGHNVRTRRDALGMTAAALGERIGEALGKPWPRQTVYMMESGDRAMVAQEVAALSQILDVPITKLFAPPSDVKQIQAGNLLIQPETLLVSAEDRTDEIFTRDLQDGPDKKRAEVMAKMSYDALLERVVNACMDPTKGPQRIIEIDTAARKMEAADRESLEDSITYAFLTELMAQISERLKGTEGDEVLARMEKNNGKGK